MSIRDLRFPDDARKTVESLVSGLVYDAAVAHCGLAVSGAHIDPNAPVFKTGFRHGGGAVDVAVLRDLPSLLCRLAVISMVSRFEVHAQNLLLQRRVLEEIGPKNERLTGPRFWPIIKKVHEESRSGPVKLCSELVVAAPTPELQSRMPWLEGIYRMRNCLTHRFGVVQLADVRLPGQEWHQMQDGQTLKCTWLRARAYLDGKSVDSFPFQMGEKMDVRFEESTKEWRIGETITLTPEECQSLSMSLSFVANQMLACFETEVTTLLRPVKG